MLFRSIRKKPAIEPQLQKIADDLATVRASLPQRDDSHRAIQRIDARLDLLERNILTRRTPLPPDHLQTRQVGSVWGELFFSEGRKMFDQIAQAFSQAGCELTAAGNILDFGCGCGRVLAAFENYPVTGEVWGADVDREAILWSRANLGHLAQFWENGEMPPTRFPDGFFGAIYSVSVFTHLPEHVQFAWLNEMQRLLRPGGMMIASLHGAHYWTADPHVQAEVKERGFAYRTGEKTPGLPAYYMVAFHSEAYVREKWTAYFDVVAYHPKYIHSLHDAVVLRKR